MEFDENIVLRILALGLDNSTPNHRIEYLLKKLYRKDSMILDVENTKFLDRIKEIAEFMRD